MKFVFLIFFGLFSSLLHAQDFEWWRRNVNWDGSTHWSKYIIVSPAYLGPNALAVPDMNNGSIDSAVFLGVSAAAHFSKGDFTQNMLLHGNYTTPNNSISFEMQFVPVEHFKMSHDIKSRRHVFSHFYNARFTSGDVLAATRLQLFQKQRQKYQLAFRLGLRMPSGGMMGAARYGNVPAYWLDLGGAIPLKNKHWKWTGMLGFLSWQTNQDTLRQNDGPLWGSGFEWNKGAYRVQIHTAGYSGYKNNGDRPVVFRFLFDYSRLNKRFLLRFQQGFHDFYYSSAEVGLFFKFR